MKQILTLTAFLLLSETLVAQVRDEMLVDAQWLESRLESEQLHYISFANQEVAISSAFPEVIAPFLLAFEALL